MDLRASIIAEAAQDKLSKLNDEDFTSQQGKISKGDNIDLLAYFLYALRHNKTDKARVFFARLFTMKLDEAVYKPEMVDALKIIWDKDKKQKTTDLENIDTMYKSFPDFVTNYNIRKKSYDEFRRAIDPEWQQVKKTDKVTESPKAEKPTPPPRPLRKDRTEAKSKSSQIPKWALPGIDEAAKLREKKEEEEKTKEKQPISKHGR